MALTSNKRRPIIIGPDTPVDPKETDLWIDSADNKIYRWNGSTWALVSDAVTQSYVDTAVSNLVDAAPGLLDTLNELAAAIGDDASFATTVFNSISSASTTLTTYTDDSFASLGASLSAVINSASVSAQTNSNSYTDGEINTLEAALIGTINTASGAAVTSANSYTDTAISAVSTTDVAEGTNLYFTNQRAIDAGSATYLTTSDAATTYLPLTGGTISSDLTVSGNLTVSGSATYVDTANLNVTDSLINLSTEQYAADALDQGFTASYGTGGGNENDHKHRGLVYDITDSKWKFFGEVAASAISSTVDFTNAQYQDVKAKSLDLTGSVVAVGNVTASAFVGDGSQLTGINLSTKADKLNTFDQETASYTLVLGNADQIVEMNVASANDLTVPANADVAFPVGTEITILQTGAGQTTLKGGSGVTINATPGLKIRAQWGAATLIKRATNTWVAVGDLSA